MLLLLSRAKSEKVQSHLSELQKCTNAIHLCDKFLVYFQRIFALLSGHVEEFLCRQKQNSNGDQICA